MTGWSRETRRYRHGFSKRRLWKPRPAVVVQSDALLGTDSVLVALVTSTERDAPFFRLYLEPSNSTGLRQRSWVMVDKIFAVSRRKCGPAIGHIEQAALPNLQQMLLVMLGLAD